MTDFDVDQYLSSCSTLDDPELDLGILALAMVAPDHGDLSLDRYKNHLSSLKKDVEARYQLLIEQGADDDAGVRLAALKHVLYDTYHYSEDEMGFEVLESADIFRVIDRGRGGSTALAILYMDVARHLGWPVEGLNFPNRFLCRLSVGAERVIFDPSCPTHVLAAHDLRAIVKGALGDEAELSAHYLEGIGARASVIHVCNILKLRHIEMGGYAEALDLVERMCVIAPDEYRLLLDAGVLFMRTGKPKQARTRLLEYIDLTPNPADKDEAYLLLQDLE